MKKLTIIIALLLLLAFIPFSFQPEGIRVGSKKFTESVILGECLKQLAEDANQPAIHYRELGGTKLVFESLVNGELDAYVEYTGTIREEILGGEEAKTLEEMRELLQRRGIHMSEPLGFNNTYALALKRSRAEELGVKTVSDLTRHPDLVYGFGNEFMARQDGWPGLQAAYGLTPSKVSGLDHDLAYRQIDLGTIDVTDAYSTDAKIKVHDLVLLEDDRNYFPRYDAVVLYRADLAKRHPEVVQSIERLQSSIDEPTMTASNARTEVERVTESQVAADLVFDLFGVKANVEKSTLAGRLFRRTLEHLDLVRKSLIPAILLAIPLGIVAVKFPQFGSAVLGVVGIIQTIPSLALLVMLMPLMAFLGMASIGTGSATAITALLLYSLLPIVRNTHTGLKSISPQHQQAALALGLPAGYRLLNIELPLASRSILGGIKTAAVMNVGFATLGALIGAGGFGQPIITGIRLNDTGLILEGAIPAALMAVVVQFGFDAIEKLNSPPEK
ncbi:MAG: glycine betaine ABC transporter substrate-binding protein [Planctomycetaceae bacterium]